jgi:hypothetical protein
MAVSGTAERPQGRGQAHLSSDLFYEGLVEGYQAAPINVHRRWLHDAVGEGIRRADRRYVLLVGEPGAGKTGLMAALAHAHPEWLRYFIRSDSTTPLSGGAATSLFLRFGHQLAHRHPELFDPELLEIVVNQRVGQAASVTGVRIEDLRVSPFYRTAIRVQQDVGALSGGLVGVEVLQATLEPRLLEPETLGHLALLDPAAALARIRPNESLIVLVDALDEVGDTRSIDTILDWLESGPELPPNVRFVLSSRPDERLKSIRGVRGSQVHEIGIEAASPDVAADVRTFAVRLFDEIKSPAAGREFNTETAAAALGRSARGNFAYLTAYARALRAAQEAGDAAGLDELLRFETLPAGLYPLFAAFVRRVRRQVGRLGLMEIENPAAGGDELTDPWEGVGQRFLGVLAVARAPLPLSQLVSMGRVRVWESSARRVLKLLLPFLDQTPTGYEFFHPSFREFLTSTLDPDFEDVAIDAREWNTQIVRFYRTGREWSQVDWQQVDDYGLLHLVEHLAGTGADSDTIGALVTFELRRASMDRFGSDLPFRRTVEVARGVAERSPDFAKMLAGTVFCDVLLSGLSDAAASLDPAVYGLMARCGRVREALSRVEVLAPDRRKYCSLEAIRASTPATDRAALGPIDGVERLIAAALDVPQTSPTDLFSLARPECLKAAIAAIAPHDLDRAERLVGLLPERDQAGAHDEALAAAASTAGPEAALGLLERVGDAAASTATDLAVRAGTPEERRRYSAIALERSRMLKAGERAKVLGKVLALGRRAVGLVERAGIFSAGAGRRSL